MRGRLTARFRQMRMLFDRRVQGSLFLLPLTVIVICAGAAVLVLILEKGASEPGVPFLLATTVSGGRVIVTAVAGATITVAAIVFSITALSTQMAANQYSPRALRGFFEDPFQQVVLGLVVGTFIYSLLVLGGLAAAADNATDPARSVSVTLDIVLGVLSVIGIVAYLDHSLRRVQIDAVVQRIAGAALEAVRREHREIGNTKPSIEGTGTPHGEPLIVVADRSGWILRIEARALSAALPENSMAKVGVRLGEAVSVGDRLVTIWPSPGEDSRLARRVRRSIRSGKERSVATNPAFGIRQLVDIALKALSPGVNDPTTAVDVIHHLKVPVREILVSEPPTRVFGGPRGQRVILAETPSRSDHVHAAFSEIRLASTGQPSVIRALIEVLGDLRTELEAAELTGRVDAVAEELSLTIEAARHSRLPKEDIARVLRSVDEAGE
jgi:uncharacterized membrane protein